MYNCNPLAISPTELGGIYTRVNIHNIKLRRDMRFFTFIFLPDLYAPEMQFQVLASQTLVLKYIAHDHTEIKP